MEKVKQLLLDIEMESYYPLFEENQIFFDDLKDLTPEDLKEIGINSLPHRKRIFASIQQHVVTAPALPILINFEHLPYPAVLRFNQINQAITSFASGWDVVSYYKDSVEALIKTFCVYCIGQYISSKKRNIENDAALLKMLSRPSTGIWLNILQKVLILNKTGPDPMGCLYKMFYTEKKGKDCQNESLVFLLKFVQFRNELHHAARVSEQEYINELSHQLPVLQELLDQSLFLKDYPLYKGLLDNSALNLAGIKPKPEFFEFPENLAGKLFFIDSEHGFIEVEPFFIFLKMEDREQETLFLYDSQKSYGNRKELKMLYMIDYNHGNRVARYEPVEILESKFGEELLLEVFTAFKATILSMGAHVNNFSAILNKHASITGREFIKKRIDQFKDEMEAGYFILEGGPGIGKTAIMANLINPVEKQAHYFFKAGSNYDNPDDCIRSLLHFLAQKHNIAVSQISGTQEQIRLDFEDLLVQVSNFLLPGKYETIILDAIDEASKTNDGKSICEILPAILPRNVFFIISTRPNNIGLNFLKTNEGFYKYFLDPAGEDNRRDAYDFIATMLDGKVDKLRQKEIADKAAWNFLIIKLIAEAILKDNYTPEDIDDFLDSGSDLQNWYQGYYDRISHNFGEEPEKMEKILAILGAIAAAGDPVSKTQICDILDISNSGFDWSMRYMGQFLDIISISEKGINKKGINNELFYRFYHASFMNYVSNKLFNQHNPYHKNWADYYSDWLEKTGFEHDYAIKSYPRHLHLSGQRAKLLEVITNPVFVMESAKIEKHYELAAYWRLFSREETENSIENEFKKLNPEYEFLIQCALNVGELLQHLGRYPQAIIYYKRAFNMATEHHDTEKMGEARFATGWCLRHIDKFQEAIDELSEAIKLFQSTDNNQRVAQTYSIMGINQWQLHLDMDALNSLEKSLQLFENTDSIRMKAEAHNHMGIIYRGLGQYEQALFHLRKTRELLGINNDIKGLGKVMNSLGTATWWSGDPASSILYYDKANEINEKIGQFYIMGITWNNLGYIYLELDKPGLAIKAFETAREIRRKIEVRSFELMDISGLALSNYKSGNRNKAVLFSSEAIEGLKEFNTVEDLQRAWFNHYLILNGFPEHQTEAKQALERAWILVMERYGRITDPAFQKSYLEEIKLNKAIISATEIERTKNG